MFARTLPLLLAPSAVLLAAPGSGQSEIFGFDGAPMIAPAGDTDGDGRPDILLQDAPGHVQIVSGRTGLPLLSMLATGFGAALDGGLDLDGDRVPDQIAGSPTSSGYAGAVEVFSGASGGTIHAHLGDLPGLGLGSAVALVGDTNGDAVPDYLVGATAWDYLGMQNAGSAVLYSGASGALLHQWYGEQQYESFGWSVDGLGDVDGDGLCDVAVGKPELSMGDRHRGRVRVFSGGDGSLLYEVLGPRQGILYGSSVSGGGDVNGDGIGDLLVGGWWIHDGRNVGVAGCHDGRDGSLLWRKVGRTPEENLARSVAFLGDLDQDGRSDAALGAPQWDGAPLTGPVGPGLVRVVSGKDGAELFTVPGELPLQLFGRAVAGLGDVNQDGTPDLGVGAPSYAGLEAASGVFSGEALALTGLPHAISLSAGGAQAFALSAGARHAGEIYLLLGTTAGTSPGLLLPGGVLLPLTPDGPGGYLTWSLLHPGVPPLGDTLGLLDAAGGGTAAFVTPPGFVPALAGLTLDHAFVVLDASLGAVMASNAVVLSLLP